LPIKIDVTGGEVSDYRGFDILAGDGLPKATVFLADRGYDSDHIRKTIDERGGTAVIPGKTNRKTPILVDGITYALRNRGERCFNKLKCSRRMATRYDKTAASYLGFVQIAAARLSIRSLST
jgi:transposase